MTIRVEQTILWLQITVDNTNVAVQMLKSKNHLSHVERGNVLAKHALHGQVSEKLTTLGVLQNQVESLVVLESVEELDDEGMAVDTLENAALGTSLLDKALVDSQGSLAKLLLGEQATSGTLFDQMNCAKGSLAQAPERFEVIGRHLAQDGFSTETTFDREGMPGCGTGVCTGEVVLEVDLVCFQVLCVDVASG